MKKIIGILMLAVLVASCKKSEEQLGPDLVGINGPVTIVENLAVNTSSVNFTTGEKVFFTAKFQNSAVWTITIVGTNGAQKTITGISKEINADNSTWTGTTDILPSFIAGTVTATLTFQSDTQTQNTSISITGVRVSDKSTDVLVTNFVVSKVQNYGASPVPPSKWPSDWPPSVNTNSSYPKPDGNAYMYMGPAAPWQGGGSPYVDIITISPGNSDTNYGTYFPLYADPTKVYFNIMVYNTGTPTWLQISFFEDGVTGAARHIDIKPNWTGWKLVSVKYSDLVANSNDTAANIQSQKVTAVQIVMLSNTPIASLPGPAVSSAFDHITFTHNEPYQP